MSSIPVGNWDIECVLVNQTTVMNNDGIRALEILEDEWVIQPAGQRFRIRQAMKQSSGLNSAVLESGGEVYFVEFSVEGNSMSLAMSRPHIKETIHIEAVAIGDRVTSIV
ncbi:MAG: hypothetical protein P8J27_09155 [Mariniblastus sp.]|nr:hypothetical protein [Mariniblastus sp.]